MLAVLIYLVLVIFLICANDDVSAFFSNYSSHDLYDKYPGYGKDWIFFPDGDGHPQKLNLVERDYFATKISDFSKYVNFYLYTRFVILNKWSQNYLLFLLRKLNLKFSFF